MPHGVVPPAQLPKVPSAGRAGRVGRRLAAGRDPAAGPLNVNGVDAVIRRFCGAPTTYAHGCALRGAASARRRAMPCAAIATRRCSSSSSGVVAGGNMMFSFVYSWLAAPARRVRPRRIGDDVEVVVVVAELPLLQRGGLVGRVERVGASENSGSPQRMIGGPPVAAGARRTVDGRGHRARSGVERRACPRRRALRRRAQHRRPPRRRPRTAERATRPGEDSSAGDSAHRRCRGSTRCRSCSAPGGSTRRRTSGGR